MFTNNRYYLLILTKCKVVRKTVFFAQFQSFCISFLKAGFFSMLILVSDKVVWDVPCISSYKLLMQPLGSKQMELVILCKICSIRKHLGSPSLIWNNLNPSIPVCMNKHMYTDVCKEITHPSPNSNGCTVEVWKWISNFTQHCDWCYFFSLLGIKCLSCVNAQDWIEWQFLNCMIDVISCCEYN